MKKSEGDCEAETSVFHLSPKQGAKFLLDHPASMIMYKCLLVLLAPTSIILTTIILPFADLPVLLSDGNLHNMFGIVFCVVAIFFPTAH